MRTILTAKATSENAQARRAAILEAARSLFLSRGYDEVGVRDVAREAGVSPALVYRYGWSKVDLLAELIFELNGTQVDAMRAWRPPRSATLEKRVLAFVRRLSELDTTQKDLRRLGAAYGWLWSAEQDRRCIAQIVELLAPLRRLLEEAGLDQVDDRLAAIWAAYWTTFRSAVIRGADAATCTAQIQPLIALALRR